MIAHRAILILVVFGINGCSSVDFYEEQEDGTEKESGFLYYPPKPYLLVEEKDDAIVIEKEDSRFGIRIIYRSVASE